MEIGRNRNEKKIDTSTTISKALQNEVIDSVHNEYELEKLQKKWLIENIYRIFKAECTETQRNTQIDELFDKFKSEGIKYEIKKEGFGYNAKETPIIHLQHLDLQLTKSSGWESGKGNYNGIGTYIFDRYTSIRFTWISPADAVKFLKEIDALIPLWQEKEWPKTLLEAQKKAKMKSMSENTIKTMVTIKMKNAGIPYAFVYQKQRVKVIFDLGHNTQMEMFISHKKFQEQIDKVIQNAKAVKQLMDETDITISMKKLDKYLSWND